MKIFSLFVGTVLCFATSQANAEGFIGGALGLAVHPDYVSQLVTIATTTVAKANPGTPIGGSGSQRSISGAAKLFGGGWFNDYVGVELGYANLGTTKATVNTTGVATTWTDDISNKAAYGAILFRWKSSDTQSIHLKVGQYKANTTFSASATGPSGASRMKTSASNTGLLFGLGSSMKLAPHWSERMEIERFNAVGDEYVGKGNITMISAGIAYEF
jgi:hypothetical protein